MSHVPPGPFIPHVTGYTHRVRCDQAHWDRSRTVYWHVLDVLWGHADSFVLHEVRPELWEPVLHLPDVRPLEHPWGAKPGDLNEQGRPFPVFLGGPTTPAARQVLIDPTREVWFSLTLKRGEQEIFYDEDGGDTMSFVAQPDTLEQLAARGVTPEDLLDLSRANRQSAVLTQVQAQLVRRLSDSFGYGGLYLYPVRVTARFAGGGYRAVVLVEADALDRLADAAAPEAAVDALWAAVHGLAEPTDAFRITASPSVGIGERLVGSEAGVHLIQLHPELRPHRSLVAGNRRHPVAKDSPLWPRLIALAAAESDRILLTTPPVGDLADLKRLGVEERPPQPAWLDRVAQVRLASCPSFEFAGERHVLPVSEAAIAVLQEGWRPWDGWGLSFVRDGEVWLEADRRGVRLERSLLPADSELGKLF